MSAATVRAVVLAGLAGVIALAGPAAAQPPAEAPPTADAAAADQAPPPPAAPAAKQAVSPPSQPPNETPYQVLRRPTKDEQTFPQAALRAGVDGEVRVQCRMALTYRLEDCKILSENPVGYGYGEAALRTAGYYRIIPPSVGGRPYTDAQIIIPFTWDVLEPASAPPAPSVKPRGGGVVEAPIFVDPRTGDPVRRETGSAPPAPPKPRPPPVRSPEAMWAPILFAFVMALFLLPALAKRPGKRRRAGQYA